MVETQIKHTRKILAKPKPSLKTQQQQTSVATTPISEETQKPRSESTVVEPAPVTSTSFLSPPKFPESAKVREFLDKLTVHDILLDSWESKSLITVRNNETLERALELFKRHNIMSMPVVESNTGRLLGLVDVLDVLHHLSDIFRQPGFLSEQKWDFLVANMREILDKGSNEREHLLIASSAKIAKATSQLTQGHHRLIVVNKPSLNTPTPMNAVQQPDVVFGLLTQMDLVRFIAKNMMWFAEIFERTLEEAGIAKGEREVLQVSPDTPTFVAFKQIYNAKIHGCAIVDENGKLVGNLSASNIKGINRSNFHVLTQPVSEFLARDKQRKWYDVPVSAKPYHKMKEVILQFVSSKVHRIYITSDEGRPVGVVSLTDVLNVLNSQLSSQSRNLVFAQH